MAKYDLNGCAFDQTVQKEKYSVIWGRYWEEQRIRVQDGIVYVTSKSMAGHTAKMLHNHVFTDYKYGEIRGFIATSTSGDKFTTYRFADACTSEQFFAALQRSASVAPDPRSGKVLSRSMLGCYETGPFAQFVSLLPASSRAISQETTDIIKQKMATRLTTIIDQRDAQLLLADAEAIPHWATAERLEAAAQVILTGEFHQPAANGTVLLQAYSRSDGSPKIIKMGGAQDFDRFAQLDISRKRANELHLVFIESKFDDAGTSQLLQQAADVQAAGSAVAAVQGAPQHRVGKNAAVMSAYHGSLAAVPWLPDSVLLHRLATMVVALHFLHCTYLGTRAPLYHCDVKVENIFIAQSGAWYLGDYGSLCAGESDPQYSPSNTTAAYVPYDAAVVPSAALDMWMLVVAVLLKVRHPQLSARQRFSQQQVHNAIAQVESADLRNELMRLVDSHPLPKDVEGKK